jgi:hypothetical protein
MVYPRLVFFLIQQDTPFLLPYSYTTSKHNSIKVPLILLIAVGVTGLTVALSTKSSISQLPPSTISTPTPAPTVTPTQTNSPNGLTITVSVAQPEDLKVKENQRIQAGELIADRGRERTRLEGCSSSACCRYGSKVPRGRRQH